MQIYKFKRRSSAAWGRVFRRFVEGVFKSLILLMFPVPATAFVLGFWYLVLYENHIHLDKQLHEIAVSAWIPIFGVIYAIIAAQVVASATQKIDAAHAAVDDHDEETFMRLCDAEVSPATHALMSLLAFAIIGGFMALDYPSVEGGALFVGTTTYLFSLCFWVVVEFDDPRHGIWFIKSIPAEWLAKDPKEESKQRKIRQAERRRRERCEIVPRSS